MTKAAAETRLCAVFVDYDNIYLSLRRQDEAAAKQFPKDVIGWLQQLESGEMITETGRSSTKVQRRLVMCRCYGNPVPRRNSRDNSTDIGSFPFVRHHFLRAGFDIVDCPPLTAQLKNSSDIRMVMDIQDFLDHKTHFDEFIILSGDADFAPILQRLRTHARHTTIYVNENTATPYVAICDAQVREQDLLTRLRKAAKQDKSNKRKIENRQQNQLPDPHEQTSLADLRNRITAEIERVVASSDKPVALAYLADKAQRNLSHEETVGSNWANYGSFLSFLQNNLPEGMHLSTNQPYYVIDERRHTQTSAETPPVTQIQEPQNNIPQTIPQRQLEARRLVENNSSIRETIGRVHEFTHVPALAPSEYQILFEVTASELSEVGLKGRQTALNISSRAKSEAVDLSPEDSQFILDIISEADPWFEKGISPQLFAERFRNAIVARCRGNGLHLNQDEYELVSAWFMGDMKSPWFVDQNQQATLEAPQPQNNEALWLDANSDEELLVERPTPIRQPYVDPLNHNHELAREKSLPRIFRFGSDG